MKGVRFGGVITTKNTKIVTHYSQLTGSLSSDIVYIIDGIIDMIDNSIIVPQGGLNIQGLGFGISCLLSTEDNFTLFIDDGVFAGDLFLDHIEFDISGTSSKVFDLDNDENFNAVECTTVNFLNCQSLGVLNNYRQGLWTNVALIGCVDGLEMGGVWSGGFASLTAIVVGGVSPTFTGTIFKAGAGLTIGGRFRSDMNAEGMASSGTFCDFSPANIINNGRFQMVSVSVPPDSNSFPNMPESDPKARFRICDGTPNTYVGGQWKISTEVATTINTINVIEKVAGTTTYTDLQHFTDGGGNNSLTYVGTQEIGVNMYMDVSFTGSNNNELILVARHWIAATSSYVDLSETGPFTLNAAGRSAPVSLHSFCEFNNNDRFEVWVKNITGSGNVTAKIAGIVSLSERSS